MKRTDTKQGLTAIMLCMWLVTRCAAPCTYARHSFALSLDASLFKRRRKRRRNGDVLNPRFTTRKPDAAEEHSQSHGDTCVDNNKVGMGR